MTAEIDQEIVRSQLDALVEYFKIEEAKIKQAFYTELAKKLSDIVHRSDPWTWRYVQSVHKGTMKASPEFARAVTSLGAAIDEVPMMIIDSEPVQVYARRGTVVQGAFILASSKPCDNPSCRFHFVPVVPRQRFCSRKCQIEDYHRRIRGQ